MRDILKLRKFVAPEFVFGLDARKLVSQYVANLGGNRVLVVSDPGVVAAGWTEEVQAELKRAGFETILYIGVTPNPRDVEVETGASLFREKDCDIIVAVGGGSPMDCAKGICAAVGNYKSVGEFEGVDQVELPGPPLICVPTTSGTAADLSQFAIIDNLEQHRKYAIISKMVVPDVALIDPLTNVSKGPYLTACTGIDSLVHAIEAFVSTASSPITDTHALKAIKLIRTGLPKVLDNPDDVATRAQVTLGCLHAGLAFSNASLGAVHAMAHSLGGLLDLPHGECNAILLRHVMEYNKSTVTERYAVLAEHLGLDLRGLAAKAKTDAVIGEINRFTTDAGITESLGKKGVKSGDVPELAHNALIDPCMITNPKAPNQRDIEVIYEEAL